jgi:hypothetical protein
MVRNRYQHPWSIHGSQQVPASMVHPRHKVTYHLGSHPWWGASGSHRLYATEWERNGNRLGESRSSEQVRWNRTCVLRGSWTASGRPRGLERDRPSRDDARSLRRRKQRPSSSSASGRRRGAPGVCLLALVLGFSSAFALPTHSELGCTCCRTEEKLPHSSEALQVSWR